MAYPQRSLPELTEKQKQRFWKNVTYNSANGCWEWTGCRDKNGYGLFGIGKQRKGESRQYLAHRIAYTLQHGPVPAGMQVRHGCDNPPCVFHLALGTMQDNMRDRDERNRTATGMRNGRHTHPEKTAKGSRNGKSKLTEDIVREIRRRRAEGETTVALGKEFGVQSCVISRVARGLEWKHVS